MIVSVTLLFISAKSPFRGEKRLKLLWKNVAFDPVQDYFTLH